MGKYDDGGGDWPFVGEIDGKGVGPVVGAEVGDSASSSLLEEALLDEG